MTNPNPNPVPPMGGQQPPARPAHAAPQQASAYQQPQPQPTPAYQQPQPAPNPQPAPQATPNYQQPPMQPPAYQQANGPQPGGYTPAWQQQPTDPACQPIPGCPFTVAIVRYWTGYVRMRGRASRSEYWFSVLFNLLVSIVLGIIVGIAGSGLEFLITLYMLATFIPTLTISVRRLHDSDKSGLYMLLIYGLSFLGGIVIVFGGIGAMAGTITGFAGATDLSLLGGSIGMLVVGGLICLAAFIIQIVLMCLPSKPSGARYDR